MNTVSWNNGHRHSQKSKFHWSRNPPKEARSRAESNFEKLGATRGTRKSNPEKQALITNFYFRLIRGAWLDHLANTQTPKHPYQKTDQQLYFKELAAEEFAADTLPFERNLHLWCRTRGWPHCCPCSRWDPGHGTFLDLLCPVSTTHCEQ